MHPCQRGIQRQVSLKNGIIREIERRQDINEWRRDMGVLMMLQNPHIDTKLQRPFELPTSDSEAGSPWKNWSLEVQAVPGLLGSGRNARRIASRADVPRCQCRAYGGEEPIVESSHSDHCAAAAQNRLFVRRLMKDRRSP